MPINTIASLKQRIAELETENTILHEQVDFLTGIPDIQAGIRGETLIADMVHGAMTIHSAAHDVVSRNGVKIEVKFSRLNTPNKGSSSRRWSWNYPLGLKQKKDYDRLILIGIADPRFRQSYKDPSSPYVIFDIPMQDVAAMTQAENHISITTDPTRRGEGTRPLLFREFQATTSELNQRYGIKKR
jgi:hypothetical protein